MLTDVAGGKWQLMRKNFGITAMHMQLLHNDQVLIYDQTNFGKSIISLPGGKCQNNPNDTALVINCIAHFVKYDV